MNKTIKNTNKEFYKDWTKEQLIKELCRMNKILVSCLKIVLKMLKLTK